MKMTKNWLTIVWILALAWTTTGWSRPALAAQELDKIVAVVNDEVILDSELKSFLQTIVSQLRRQNTPLPPARVLAKQGLERMIIQRVQLQMAANTGIRIDDESLNQAIAGIAAQNRMDLESFRQALEADGFGFAKFREDVRSEMIIARLQQRNIEKRVRVSNQEIDTYLEREKNRATPQNQYRLAHILIALPDAASPDQIRETRDKAAKILAELRAGADFKTTAVAVSEGQNALQGGDMGWLRQDQLPSVFSGVVEELKPGAISDILRSSSGFHIIQLLEVKGADTALKVKQTKARHILLRTSELLSDEDARIRLQQLRQRIQNGDNFAALARAHSEDTLSARKGGDLGWVSAGDTVPQFEEVMGRLSPGQVSEPFKSQFGWHIVQVLERREHDDSQAVQRSQARKILRNRKAQEALQLWLRQLRDEAYVEYRLNV